MSPDDIYKLGAGGVVLVLVLLGARGAWVLASKLVDRVIAGFDRMVIALERVPDQIAAANLGHASTQAHVTDEIAGTRHALRNDLINTGEGIKEHTEQQSRELVLRLRGGRTGDSADSLPAVRRHPSSPVISSEPPRRK